MMPTCKISRIENVDRKLHFIEKWLIKNEITLILMSDIFLLLNRISVLKKLNLDVPIDFQLISNKYFFGVRFFLLLLIVCGVCYIVSVDSDYDYYSNSLTHQRIAHSNHSKYV